MAVMNLLKNSWFTSSLSPQLMSVRFYRYRMRTSQRFKLEGCRFVPLSNGVWRVVTSKIPRRFHRERERGKKELKTHRTMKQFMEAKKQRDLDFKNKL